MRARINQQKMRITCIATYKNQNAFHIELQSEILENIKI